jgi:tetratricopeptide (TPR) repeat protein
MAVGVTTGFARRSRSATGLREYERALALDSTSDAAVDLAVAMLVLGRPDSMLAVLRRYRHVDPLSAHTTALGTPIYLMAGDTTLARAVCRDALALDPRAFGRCQLFLLAADRRWADAFAFASSPGLSGDRVAAVFPMIALANLGRRDEARAAMLRYEVGRRGRWSPELERAQAWAQIGDRERAVVLLDSAFVQNDADLQLLACLPNLRPLRGDGRFDAMLRRVAPR